jgi:hypothetical protein
MSKLLLHPRFVKAREDRDRRRSQGFTVGLWPHQAFVSGRLCLSWEAAR